MRTIILSDCHISPHMNSSSLTRFLSTIECDQLIFAGDLFDLWNHSAKDIKTNCVNTITQIRKLYQRGIRVSYILGEVDETYLNDPIMGPMELPCLGRAADFCTPGGRKIIVVHGHEFDQRYLRYKFLDYCFSWITDCFKNKACTDLYGNDRIFAARDINAKARKHWSKCGANVLVMGHTLYPDRLPTQSSLCEFANAGDFVRQSTYVSIDDDNVNLLSMGKF